MIEVLRRSGCVAAMASEEENDFVIVEGDSAGDYIVVFDPLDGSSNIDVGVSIGTIFGVYRKESNEQISLESILRAGREQVAAGYIVYGSSTVLVYSAGRTVDCFTLDPSSGEFFLTRQDVRMPQKTQLSLNECNEPYWEPWVSRLLAQVKGRNQPHKRSISARHIGSLVVDFHRNLVKGGLYLYPLNAMTGRGKLRLLYECNPLAFIAEVAGGAASNGHTAILDLKPEELHQRVGLIIGPSEDVFLAETLIKDTSMG